jgi:hypothetical protein
MGHCWPWFLARATRRPIFPVHSVCRWWRRPVGAHGLWPAGGLGLCCGGACRLHDDALAVPLALERERGVGESLGPAYVPVMAMLLDAVYLLEGVILSPHSSLRCAFRVKTLTTLVAR